jgi:serine/threonine protein kinase
MENETNIGSSLLDFNLIEDLGKGNFGSVSLMQSKKDNNIYAIKEIKSSVLAKKQEIRSLKREIQVLKELDHPNIIKYYTSFTENDNVYIVMQYINNGNLKTLMKDEGKDYLDEKKIWDYLIQSLRGLKYLHDKKKIIHRDIKPDNILLDLNNNIKISDFGVSAINSADASSTVKFNGTREGTLQFMAPEVINGKAYDFKSDIYMLGITFFYILSKHFPSKRCNYKNIIVDIVNPNAELPEVYSRILRRFIKKLLEINPNQRPSAENAYCMAISYYTTLYLKII